MAGDWIKVDHGLHEKPEVQYLSAVLKIDPFAVVGMLVRVWEWFDRHTSDGYAANVTVFAIDRIVFREGFGEAMTFAGWLIQENHGLRLPNFDRHNGITAKNRALARDRMSRKRYAANVTLFEKVTPREEKRLKEKALGQPRLKAPTPVKARSMKTLKELLPEQEQQQIADALRAII